MEDAEEAGKKGYEFNKDDPWSQHAVSLPGFTSFIQFIALNLVHIITYPCFNFK